MPNMTVLVPCDAVETQKATVAAVAINSPVYIRLAREKTPIITTANSPYEVGKANVLWDAEKIDVAIIGAGPVLYNALAAARELEKTGTKVRVINLHTIKPLDEETIIKAARDAGRVVTVEEHQVAGGVGSAVAELLAKNYPVPMRFVGVQDQFGQSGKPQELLAYYGIDTKSIIEAVKKII
jgi:transketolase